MAQYKTSFENAEPQSTEDHIVINDRRRTGRPDHVNPTLVPLLRGDLMAGLPLSDETKLLENCGILAHVAGIAAAVCASALIWAVISFVVKAMLP